MLFKVGDTVKLIETGIYWAGKIEHTIKKIYKIHTTTSGVILQVIPGDFNDIIKIKDEKVMKYMWYANSCELVENKCICSMNQLLAYGCICGGN